MAATWIEDHEREVSAALAGLRRDWPTLQDWGYRLVEAFTSGGRLLAVGNGGSAAEAQHLTSELVGRFLDDRRPLSAICLSSETSSLTAIVNDYGVHEMFARQVEAHGRPGDVLVLLSTSGRSPNVLAAAERAADLGIRTWAITGPGPNPLSVRCDEALTVRAPSTQQSRPCTSSRSTACVPSSTPRSPRYPPGAGSGRRCRRSSAPQWIRS